MSEYDVIVIGSGIGGLSAALTCARGGRSVLVVEAAKQFGGFLNPFSRKKFWFDTGIHYVGEMAPGQALYKQFERLGLLETLEFRELNPDGFDRYVFPDYEVSMCKGLDRYRARLTRDFPHQASGLRNFFKLLESITATLAQASAITSPLSALRMLPRLPQLLKYHRKTYGQILDEFFTDIRLKAVLAAQGGDIGLPPGKASGLIMLAVVGHFSSGAHFPVGGTKAVRDAYVSHLERYGVTMKRNTPVARILTSGGRASGVCTADGQVYSAPTVISNAGAVRTYDDFLGHVGLNRRLRRKVAGCTQSLGSLCAFIGTNLQPTDHGLSDANIWHYPSYDIDGLYADAFNGRIPDEMPFFLTVPTLKDPGCSHAPEGKHTVELITFAPAKPFAPWKDQRTMKRDADYVEFKNRLGMQLVKRAETYFPGLSDAMEVHEFATPVTNSWFVGVPDGAIYGLAHTPEQIGLGRFTANTPVPGVFLCGSDVIGAGISPCVASGNMAARMAMKFQRRSASRLPALRPLELATR